MTPQETAQALAVTHQGQQLCLFASTGFCWFDRLLSELAEITGSDEEVETLQNYTHMMLMTEEWKTIGVLVAHGNLLRDMKKSGTDSLFKAIKQGVSV